MSQARSGFEVGGFDFAGRRIWSRRDGYGGSSVAACAVRSPGIVVPLPTHDRKDADVARRHDSRGRREIGGSAGIADGIAMRRLVDHSHGTGNLCVYPVFKPCTRAFTFRMRALTP